ncbi:MAG TPA: methyl-accepting chemotaxis protein [Accumulibacter sp.]|uniref:methyl-accepting chemotaxis protein n=1 Tax=Accumulibacter sp. TaxID=2053492 RepID=UPI002B84BFF6|nr:methyl-accepting chemotaxis protein [Accumulibacter sp.]HRD87021.1 methyl-accepting chemotaxis protein [Accumulibacter sp.]
MRTDHWTISKRLILITAVAVVGLAVLGVDSLYTLRGSMLQDRKDKAQVLVEVAGGVIARFHELARNGTLSDDEARKEAAETLRHMRYAGSEYFFILDTQHRFVMHPLKPELEGRSGAEMRDPNGKALIQELVRTALASERGGLVEYVFARAGSEQPAPKISYAAQFKPWGWVYGTGIYVDDISAAFRSQAIESTGIVALAVGVLVAISLVIGRSVLRQLGGEPAAAAAIARRVAAGDLAVAVDATGLVDGSLMRSIAEMQNHLRAMIAKMDHLAGAVAGRAGEIAVATGDTSRAADAQADSTAATAASIEQLTVSINEVAQSAHASGQSSDAVAGCAEQGRQLVTSSAAEIEAISAIVGRSAAQIGQLATRSREIGGIASAIKEIAEQTNLLALNAAIEAARAGEQGRGFAVVADEVRKLAERTTKATSEISAMVVSVQADTESAVAAMSEAAPQVARGLDKAREASNVLEAILRQAQKSSERVHEVAVATHEQATVAEDVARHLQHIASMTEETRATMHANSAAVAELEQLAGQLREVVARFRVA